MSQSLYNPDHAALNTRNQPWSEAFRVQRDVGLRVPINFLTTSAVTLRAACFRQNQYENSAFQKCFSNLLAVGFRKFLIDVYWDTGRSEWSLCPVQIPPAEGMEQMTTPTIVTVVSSTASAEPSTIEASQTSPTSPVAAPDGTARMKGRQEEDSSTSSAQASSDAAESPASSSSSSREPEETPITIFPTDYDEPLLEIGDYNCTTKMTLSFLTGIFQGFLDATAVTTEAAITDFILNVHVAASFSNPDAPASQPSDDELPEAGNLISDIIKVNLSDDMFFPDDLQTQRANLKRSWLDVSWGTYPQSGYYETTETDSGILSTDEGWPTEAYMEFKELYRLVVGFGSIDSQLADYNMDADLGAIFAPGVIQSNRDTTFSDSGEVNSGCLFDPNENTITGDTNSSWAISSVPPLSLASEPDLLTPIPEVTNLTACGYSTWLNDTLANTTADQNYLPYAAFVRSTLWTWQPGQPLNATSTPNSPGDNTQNRCAGMFITPPYSGRWRVLDCRERHRVACQSTNDPYHWEISRDITAYRNGEEVCPPGLLFNVPHTALENAHLLSTIINAAPPSPSENDSDDAVPNDDPVFLNLNSLNVKDCWVTQINMTCPYIPPTDTDRTRIVVVPTIAAVIIFVLAALTFFVKCAANRREDKRGRRRRMVGGWEYEGVPS